LNKLKRVNKQKPEAVNFEQYGTLEVHSIWETMQGEGPHAGRPAVFIRLAGCNLACPLCDTDYTSQRQRMSTEEIIKKVDKFKSNQLVVITGGEPFRQNIFPLCRDLLETSLRIVQIETNGTLPPSPGFVSFNEETGKSMWRMPYCQIVCSPKAGFIHELIEPHIDAYKYVVRVGEIDDQDGLPSVGALGYRKRVARPNRELNKIAEVYLQPCDEANDRDNQANWEEAALLCIRFQYRFTMQLHKLAGLS
jgi:7-carboxy-7-deazaguanine synthase